MRISDWSSDVCSSDLAGSLAMGLLIGWLARSGGSEAARLFLGVGILGGFTTFSSFSMELWALFERGQTAQAAFYVLASVAIGIAACGAGLFAMRQLPAWWATAPSSPARMTASASTAGSSGIGRAHRTR